MKFITINKYSVLIFCLFTANVLIAQQDNKVQLYPKVEWQTYGGAVLVHRDAMDSLAQNAFWGNEIRLSVQTDGSKYWHELYNYPVFGLGYYSCNFYNDIIGKPKALFLFMEFPFMRKPDSYLSTSWSIGSVFNINEYDSISNPDNIAIGSDMNVYVDFSLLYKYKLTNRIEIGAGVKMQHFSNGAYAYPNLGLNMLSGTFSIVYSPFATIDEYKVGAEIEPYNKFEVIPVFACGWRSKGQSENNIRYFNTTTSVTVNKRLNTKRTVGLGFDWFYQGYLIDYYEDKESVKPSDLMSYAAIASSDMVANRFRIVLQLGFYLYKPVDFATPYYERVALRFYVTKSLFANMSIKAHAAKAEFVEWGLGYKF